MHSVQTKQFFAIHIVSSNAQNAKNNAKKWTKEPFFHNRRQIFSTHFCKTPPVYIVKEDTEALEASFVWEEFANFFVYSMDVIEWVKECICIFGCFFAASLGSSNALYIDAA